MLLDFFVILYNSRVCFNVTESFPTFLAGLQRTFDYVTLYVAIEDIPVLRLLLQMNEDPIENFSLGPFDFHLESMPHADICEYAVFHGSNCFQLILVEVNSLNSCGPFGNVDFVNFLWENINYFGFRRHSIRMVPPISLNGPPRLLCLQHYMAASSGWD
jgi:hypothetical protein